MKGGGSGSLHHCTVLDHDALILLWKWHTELSGAVLACVVIKQLTPRVCLLFIDDSTRQGQPIILRLDYCVLLLLLLTAAVRSVHRTMSTRGHVAGCEVVLHRDVAL